MVDSQKGVISMNQSNFSTEDKKFLFRRVVFIVLPASVAFWKIYCIVVNFLLALGLR